MCAGVLMCIQLFTIGYEGRDLPVFLDCLDTNEIKCLVDVREIAFSRKKGFSKTALSQALKARGIEYVHIRNLGSPRPLREELKSGGDYGRFFREMDKYLSAQGEAIERAYDCARRMRSCLMCYEKQAAACHRRVVARKVKERDGNGLEVTHL